MINFKKIIVIVVFTAFTTTCEGLIEGLSNTNSKRTILFGQNDQISLFHDASSGIDVIPGGSVDTADLWRLPPGGAGAPGLDRTPDRRGKSTVSEIQSWHESAGGGTAHFSAAPASAAG